LGYGVKDLSNLVYSWPVQMGGDHIGSDSGKAEEIKARTQVGYDEYGSTQMGESVLDGLEVGNQVDLML
jgi:hypothetical protein